MRLRFELQSQSLIGHKNKSRPDFVPIVLLKDNRQRLLSCVKCTGDYLMVLMALNEWIRPQNSREEFSGIRRCSDTPQNVIRNITYTSDEGSQYCC